MQCRQSASSRLYGHQNTLPAADCHIYQYREPATGDVKNMAHRDARLFFSDDQIAALSQEPDNTAIRRLGGNWICLSTILFGTKIATLKIFRKTTEEYYKSARGRSSSAEPERRRT